MSEQTPDTSNGLSDGAEPSMEDILASIRKIIADDEGNAVQIDTELKSDIRESSTNIGALAGLDELSLPKNDAVVSTNHMETLDLDIVADVEPSDSEIDSLLADMDMMDADTVGAPIRNENMDLAVDDIADLEIPMEEGEFNALEDLIVADTDEAASEILEGDDTSDDELSMMLDEMLNDDADVLADDSDNMEKLELVVDPAEDLLSDDFEAENELQSDTVNSDSDMDLVKSLMADLTGEPLHEELTVEADMGADTGEGEDIFEALEMDLLEPEAVLDTETDTETDDVMDEILSLTLDDEMEIQASALEASDVEIPLSLKDIAEQADADAAALSGGKAFAAVAALGAVAAATNIDEDIEDPMLDAEIELLEPAESDDIDDVLSKFDDLVETTPEIETPNDLNPDEENSQMPRASKKDTIIDEVTETATAGAFASLNQVVEEKAVVAERGDRIGDLVQEALRPMLKDWLDANLKGIVERAVTKEVKRISSGK